MELDAIDRLRLLHGFFRAGEEEFFRFDFSETIRKGHSFKDFICPGTLEFEKDYFRMGKRFGRVIFLREYASFIRDSMVSELCDLPCDLMLSLDIIPVPTDEAVREVERRRLGVETNITNWQHRQNQYNNFSAVIPYDMEQQRKETQEFLDDLTTRDQRMMFGILTVVHLADSKEQLEATYRSVALHRPQAWCQFSTGPIRVWDGSTPCFPRSTEDDARSAPLPTERPAVFHPIPRAGDAHPGGILITVKCHHKNMIIATVNSFATATASFRVPGSARASW
jgi:hypothetical protein